MLSPRRAGQSRLRSHRRASTLLFNPKQKGDCGYSCILHACGIKPTASAIAELRMATSLRIRSAAINNEVLGGLPIRQVIRETQQSLNAYCASVAWDQWASAAELHAASECMGISIGLKANGHIKLNSDGVNARRVPYMICLNNSHYMLWRCHGSSYTSAWRRPMATTRGGMYHGMNLGGRGHLPGTVIDTNPRFVLAPPRITVFTDRDVATPIQSVTMLTSQHMRIGRLRQILAVLFDVQPMSFTLHLPEDPGAQPREDALIPHMIIMAGGGGHPVGDMEIKLENGAKFKIQIDLRENHLSFLRRISRVIGKETREFTTRTEDREPWIFPYDVASGTPIVELIRDPPPTESWDEARSLAIEVDFTYSPFSSQRPTRA